MFSVVRHLNFLNGQKEAETLNLYTSRKAWSTYSSSSSSFTAPTLTWTHKMHNPNRNTSIMQWSWTRWRGCRVLRMWIITHMLNLLHWIMKHSHVRVELKNPFNHAFEFINIATWTTKRLPKPLLAVRTWVLPFGFLRTGIDGWWRAVMIVRWTLNSQVAIAAVQFRSVEWGNAPFGRW